MNNYELFNKLKSLEKLEKRKVKNLDLEDILVRFTYNLNRLYFHKSMTNLMYYGLIKDSVRLEKEKLKEKKPFLKYKDDLRTKKKITRFIRLELEDIKRVKFEKVYVILLYIFKVIFFLSYMKFIPFYVEKYISANYELMYDTGLISVGITFLSFIFIYFLLFILIKICNKLLNKNIKISYKPSKIKEIFWLNKSYKNYYEKLIEYVDYVIDADMKKEIDAAELDFKDYELISDDSVKMIGNWEDFYQMMRKMTAKFKRKDRKMTKVFLATTNQGKIKDFKNLVKGYDIEVVSINDGYSPPEIVEDGITFKENSVKKALDTARYMDMITISDDSGLCVDVLDGRPGIYSARYSGENATDKKNIEKLLEEMKDKENRNAHFISVVSIAKPAGEVYSFEGRTDGVILDKESGRNGFGFDPIFYSNDLGKSFGKSTTEEKKSVSHRGRAFNLLMKDLKKIIKD